jgi:hypothetical protein
MPELLHLSATPGAPMVPIKSNVPVTAVRYHYKAAIAFADAVANATEAKTEFGVKLEPEPGEAVDATGPKTIRVTGYTKGKLIPGETSFHVGFLPKRVVAEVKRRLSKGNLVDAKLRAIEFSASTPKQTQGVSIFLDVYAAEAPVLHASGHLMSAAAEPGPPLHSSDD